MHPLPDTPALALSRWFAAPRALVFGAWIDPARAALWWGPRGFVTRFCAMDPRPGGAYRQGLRAPDGTEYIRRGVFQEIVAPARLVFTYGWEQPDGSVSFDTLVRLRFTEESGGTRLLLRQAPFPGAAARDSHRDGWSSCLDRFADYLAASHTQGSTTA